MMQKSDDWFRDLDLPQNWKGWRIRPSLWWCWIAKVPRGFPALFLMIYLFTYLFFLSAYWGSFSGLLINLCICHIYLSTYLSIYLSIVSFYFWVSLIFSDFSLDSISCSYLILSYLILSIELNFYILYAFTYLSYLCIYTCIYRKIHLLILLIYLCLCVYWVFSLPKLGLRTAPQRPVKSRT